MRATILCPGKTSLCQSRIYYSCIKQLQKKLHNLHNFLHNSPFLSHKLPWKNRIISIFYCTLSEALDQPTEQKKCEPFQNGLFWLSCLWSNGVAHDSWWHLVKSHMSRVTHWLLTCLVTAMLYVGWYFFLVFGAWQRLLTFCDHFDKATANLKAIINCHALSQMIITLINYQVYFVMSDKPVYQDQLQVTEVPGKPRVYTVYEL